MSSFDSGRSRRGVCVQLTKAVSSSGRIIVDGLETAGVRVHVATNDHAGATFYFHPIDRRRCEPDHRHFWIVHYQLEIDHHHFEPDLSISKDLFDDSSCHFFYYRLFYERHLYHHLFSASVDVRG